MKSLLRLRVKIEETVNCIDEKLVTNIFRVEIFYHLLLFVTVCNFIIIQF
jgi:hypothetical protein